MTHANDAMNWVAFNEARTSLGVHFVKIIGYFREDGVASLDAIEAAMRNHDAKGVVMPAHKLKGEAYQIGAEQLGELAEEIEHRARHFVEIRQDPDELVEKVVALRPLFHATLAAIDGEVSPLVDRRQGFGRRTDAPQTLFGRA